MLAYLSQQDNVS